jgi:phosphorylcholine metabolism protein LicD
MSLVSLWDQFSFWVMQAGLPTVAAYHVLCTSPFLNIAAEDASGLEKAGNLCLAPVQYLLAGNKAEPIYSKSGQIISYHLEQRFSYEDPLIWIKTAGAYCALPSSLFMGSVLKGISYLSSETRTRHQQIVHCLATAPIASNNEFYQSCGLKLVSIEEAERLESLGYQRRPGDEKTLQAEKAALQEISRLLNDHKIPYWVDCGTCLGAYRYGGNIPWDWDIDLAILQPDFDNVRQVLQALDPEKYQVQDWSSRDKPKVYLKVYVKESGSLIDIYHFSIHPEGKYIQSILANEGSIFLPESWRIRERRYIMPTPFDYVFPLKKINFDGVDVFIPNQAKEYLVQRYQDITPVRIYNEETKEYEKDPDHPYWKTQNNSR